MGLQLVTPPNPLAGEPVSLDEAKDHLNIPASDTTNDEKITNMIIAARMLMESSRYPGCDICFLTQTWNLVLDMFPQDGLHYIEVPKPPLQQVISITYIDWQQNTFTMPTSPASYLVDPYPELGPGCGPARILPVTPGSTGSWPSNTLQVINAVTVQFKAGFGDTVDTVPLPLKIAMLMLVGSFFENREATGDLGTALTPRRPRPPIKVPFGYDELTGLYRRTGIA